MAAHFAKRLFAMAATILVVGFVVLAAMSNLTGTRIEVMNSHGDGDALDHIMSSLSLHDTLPGRYIRYIYNMLSEGDFGPSGRSQDMTSFLKDRISVTLLLTLAGLLISILIGIPAGIAAASFKNRWPDHVINVVSFLFYAVPPFVLAIGFTSLFSLKLHWLPAFGSSSLKNYVMPLAVLSCGGVATMTRTVRSSALEIMGQQYIRVHRAKGLSTGCILFRHVLKNALPAIFASANSTAIQIISGTIIVENFYSIRGLGYTVIDSIGTRALYPLLGCVIFLTLLILSFGYVSDLLSALICPKLRASVAGKGENS